LRTSFHSTSGSRPSTSRLRVPSACGSRSHPDDDAGEAVPLSTIDELLDPIPIPRLVRVRQIFERPVIEDAEAALLSRLQAGGFLAGIRRGSRIAIGVGSRGISNQPVLVRALVRELKKAGASPFIVPAMGSHAGATAEGQKDMLVGMGLSESYLGAPIRSSMEVVRIGESENGLPVCIDRNAHEADGIVVINRIKPHVAFRAKYESGLVKMLTIGLGKQKGANICHELGFGRMGENLEAIARVIIARANLLFGVGIIENAYHETCRIEVLEAGAIMDAEPALLEAAKKRSPGIHFQTLDALIIDEIGKDISGTGFDTNVVGRFHTPYASGGPDITRVAVLDLTDKSLGNANGLGILDFTTRRVFDKMSFEHTYPNSLTSTVPLSVKIPMVLKNDRQAIQAAIKTCNILAQDEVRLVRIRNTIELQDIEISEALLEEAVRNEHLEVMSEPYEPVFDSMGNLF
jgi:hypothetical protein